MARVKFSLDSLKDLDSGKIDIAIKHELKKIVGDLNDRPGDKSMRELNIKIKLSPATDASGLCETANVGFSISSKLPPRTTRDYNMEVHPKGELIFNPASDNNAKQKTLDED